jgi:isopenicillin-N epimerase
MSSLLPGRWDELAAHNRKMVLAGRALLSEELGLAVPAPESMLGFLATLPLPPADPAKSFNPSQPDPLQDELFFKHGIEVPVFSFPARPQRALRISAQIYNDEADYKTLANALRGLILT